MNRYLLDVNIILDYYDKLRREKYPESVKVFEYLKDTKTGFVSSSSLDKIMFLKIKDIITEKQITYEEAKKAVKEMIKEITTFFNIAKTPSYLDLDEDSLEDSQILASAKSIGAIIITRDVNLLTKYPILTLHPKDFMLKITNKGTKISMLDLTKETFHLYKHIEERLDRVIYKSNFIMGDEVYEFERSIANYVGTAHAISVASGTDALLLSLRALAIKRKGKEYWSKEDLIITTPFTFTATGDTILRSGATPLFVDIDLKTYNLDPHNVKEAVKTYGKRVVGIVPVHLYGLPCNMDEIMEVARENNLFVVEDCAQALGSKFKEKIVGSFGDAGAFSFFPTKNLGAFGDAGVITTNDEELANLIKMLRVHGGKDKYNVELLGYKSRMDTIQAAILLAKFTSFEESLKKRRSIAKFYIDNLKDCSYIILPETNESLYYHTYNQFTIRLNQVDRLSLQKYLRDHGIETMVYYPLPLHLMKLFQNRCLPYNSLKNSELASMTVLSLPIDSNLLEDQLNYIVQILLAYEKN